MNHTNSDSLMPRHSHAFVQKISGRCSRSGNVIKCGCVSPPIHPHSSMHVVRNEHAHCVGKWMEIYNHVSTTSPDQRGLPDY